jgi:peptide-methionine (S)-S-oxide reductase
MQSYVLGGGCFWCLDAGYRALRGVTAVVSGYTGGHLENPDYEAVCTGQTGHAEVVRVEFDEAVISPAQILDVFFTLHDPRQLNRQGADVGTQYRSSMFYVDEAQRELFENSLERAAEIWGPGVVTEVARLGVFYEAEGYHQDFYAKNPGQGYCVAVVGPKVAKVRQSFAQLLR